MFARWFASGAPVACERRGGSLRAGRPHASAEVVRFAHAGRMRAPRWTRDCCSGSRAPNPGLDGRDWRGAQSSVNPCVRAWPGARRRDHAPRVPLHGPVTLRINPTSTSPPEAPWQGEKNIRDLLRGFGIDGPSRPRRCPRPAAWRGIGPDANRRAGTQPLLLVIDEGARLRRALAPRSLPGEASKVHTLP